MDCNKIYLSPPHLSGLEQTYINEALASNWIAPLGPQVNAFEQEMADYAGTNGALAVSSGTAAIHLALRCLGVEQGNTVFCSTLTFIGSVNPVLYLGAQPVFIDSEPESWNMSPIALQEALASADKAGKLPAAVIVIDLYGQSADMDRIKEICDSFGVPIIEDAAEAVGSSYKNRRCGSNGQFGIFSFNGNKIITTSGGGMLLSNDIESLEKARYLATQAREPVPWYEHTEKGYNYRMSNILAAIGRAQLRSLDERVAMKRRIFDVYTEELGDLEGLSFMPEASFGKTNRWLTVATIDPDKCSVKPFKIIDTLAHNNIEARLLWKPMHLQPIFKDCTYYRHSDEGVADRLFATGICLPSGSNMSDENLERVITFVKNCWR